jgi:hypothetical protein
LASRASNLDLVELEWDATCGPSIQQETSGRLHVGVGAREAVESIAVTLRSAASTHDVAQALDGLAAALAAEGLAVGPAVAAAPTVAGEQELLSHLDRHLNALATAPMIVDFADALRATPRTLTRRIGNLHERHGLTGRGGKSWRGHRDAYRLVIASIFATHREISPRQLARLVGYGSVEALDHAFRNAGLPSPVALRSSVLAA